MPDSSRICWGFSCLFFVVRLAYHCIFKDLFGSIQSHGSPQPSMYHSIILPEEASIAYQIEVLLLMSASVNEKSVKMQT